LALISLNHPDYNGREQVSHGSKDAFIIDGPGEYEVSGIYVRGLGVEDPEKKNRINTIFSVLFEGVNLCHLGALDQVDLSPEVTESLGQIDVLFVPIFGGETLDPAQAAKVATGLAPKVIIPLYANGDNGGEKLLSQFMKESGVGKAETLEKLTLRKKDLEGKQGEVVVIRPVG